MTSCILSACFIKWFDRNGDLQDSRLFHRVHEIYHPSVFYRPVCFDHYREILTELLSVGEPQGNLGRRPCLIVIEEE